MMVSYPAAAAALAALTPHQSNSTLDPIRYAPEPRISTFRRSVGGASDTSAWYVEYR